MTRPLVLSLVLALGLTACDQADPVTDADRLVGTWSAYRAYVRVQSVPVGIPVLDLDSGSDRSTVSFDADGRFSFSFDPKDGRTLKLSYGGQTFGEIPLDRDVLLSGTYTVDEAAGQLRLSTIAQTTADDFVLKFGVGTNDGLELIAEDPERLARLLGVANVGAIPQVVTGGQISYSKAGLD